MTDIDPVAVERACNGDRIIPTVQVTPAQMRCLRAFLHDGAGDERLADRLYLSRETVRAHMKALFKAAQVDCRAGLAVAIFRGHVQITEAPRKSERRSA